MAMGNFIVEEREVKPLKLDVLGMAITEIDQLSALESGMEMSSGLIVMAVNHGCAAHLAGVENGDIIFEVDSKPIRTIEDLKNQLAAHEPQEPIGLLFRRIGAWRYMALPVEENCLEGYKRSYRY